MPKPSREVRTLARLHRRELRTSLRRHMLVMLPLLAGGMHLSGWGVAYAIPLYALVLMLNFAFAPAHNLGKDRQDGTLEFLCGLPVGGRQLVLARTLALDEGCVLAGLFSAGTGLVFLSAALAPSQLLVATASMFLGSGVAMVAGATFVTWISLRFRPEHVTPAVFLLLFGAVLVLGRLGVSIGGIWSTFIALEATLVSVFAGIVALSALVALISLGLLGRAFDRCVRDPSLARIHPR